MSTIINSFKEFNLGELSLGNPSGLQGGTYFTRITNNSDPIYVLIPKCKTKNGVVSTDKKKYVDFLFSLEDESFIEWIGSLEKKMQELIFENRDKWFHNSFDLDDIENFFQTPIRVYKGNNYLLRANITTPKIIDHSSSFKIYDEQENEKIAEDITQDTPLVAILDFKGVRFSSTSFQMEIAIKQIMILEEKPIFDGCIIKQHLSVQQTSVPQTNLVAVTKTNENEKESINELDEPVSDDNNINEIKLDDTTEISEDIVNNDVDNDVDNDENKNSLTHSDVISCNNTEVLNETTTPHIENNIDQTEKMNEKSEKTELKENAGSKKEIEPLENTIVSNDPIQPSSLEEVDLDIESDAESNIELKKPNQIYLEIYRDAREKAKHAKKIAIEAYLEAQKIKSTYLLDEIESSDDEFDEFITHQ